MDDAILVLNAGSSSLKFQAFAPGPGGLEALTRGQIEGLLTAPRFIAKDAGGKALGEKRWPDGTRLGHDGAIEFLLEQREAILAGRRARAVGHRVVHGGAEFSAPVRIDASVMAKLEAYVPLAPLHQPNNLAPIKAILAAAPLLPQVACFDTAFHATNEPVVTAFALPERFAREGVRRYGFHGLSYEYVADRLRAVAPSIARGRVVIAHLGSGASLCAIRDGKSVASTMGFTAVDGLPMGTRTGALDPGVILYLMQRHAMDAKAIEKLIYNESGLLGVSGVSNDMRELRESREPRARFAIELFVHRIGRELGSLAAALGGLDALVFTAGIGENDPKLRASVCRGAAWLGLTLDEAANARGAPRISSDSSRVSAWVVPTNEELMIARHVESVLVGA
jgi:acetate kinase